MLKFLLHIKFAVFYYLRSLKKVDVGYFFRRMLIMLLKEVSCQRLLLETFLLSIAHLTHLFNYLNQIDRLVAINIEF